METMQVLGRGNQDGIDRGVVEHLPVVHEGFNGGNFRFGALKLLGIDVGYANELGIRTGRRLARNGAAAVAVADDAEANAVIRAKYVAGDGGQAAQTSSYLAKKCTPGIHETKLDLRQV
jgi:hypothetical protein